MPCEKIAMLAAVCRRTTRDCDKFGVVYVTEKIQFMLFLNRLLATNVVQKSQGQPDSDFVAVRDVFN